MFSKLLSINCHLNMLKMYVVGKLLLYGAQFWKDILAILELFL